MGAERQVAVFQIGQEYFAIDIMQIGLIERWQPVRRIPRSPDFLEGVIDLRGETIVPLVNLYQRLGLESAQPEIEKRRILIARIDGLEVGFVVDAVRDVMTIPEAEVEQPPAVGSTPGFLEGLVRLPDGILLLIDVSQILTSEEILHIEDLHRALAGRAAAADKDAPTRKTRAATGKSGSGKSAGKPAKKPGKGRS